MTIKHCIQSLVLTALALASSCDQNKDSGKSFSFNPNINDQFKIRFARKSIDQKFAKTDSIAFSAGFKCLDNKDSLVLLSMNLQNIVFPKLPTAKAFEWDSLFHDLNGYSALVTLNRSGNIISVKKIRPFGAATFNPSKYDSNELEFIINRYLGEQAIKDDLNPVFAVVPNKKIRTGEMWASNIYLESKAPVKIAGAFKLDKLNADTATIEIHSIISARQGTDGRIYLEGKQTGIARISYSTGFPYDYQTNGESVYSTNDYTISMIDSLRVFRIFQ